MKTATTAPAKSTGAQGNVNAVSLLKADHRKVEQIFSSFEKSEDDDEKQKLARQVCTELIIHTKLEEELFYPACREKQVEDDMLDEAQVEHDGAKVLIADILQCSPGDDYYDAKVKTLSEYIKHHVGEEEQARSGIFAKAQKAGVDMAGLGTKIQARKQELVAQGEALSSSPPQPRSFTLNPQNRQQENSMARYDNDRDERGRFTDDNNRGRQSRGGGYQDRDEQGRFASDDDSRSSRSSHYDDDRGGSSGRGHGGWYGDSEGHSRAAEQRGGYGSRSRSYGDDRDYRSQGGYQGGQGNYRERDDQGRFTSEDDRRSSRSRDYDDDRGRSSGEGRGWYGDPEGHSRAAHEGWEERGYSGRQSRRDQDDDDRSSRSGGGGRGHGGWFGDPQGHSQASREGWRNR